MSVPAESQPAGDLSAVIGHIAILLRSGSVLSIADVSELRRMNPHHPPSAFFKLEGAALTGRLPRDPAALSDRETHWAAVVCGLAHLGELHRPGVRLGRALADAKYGELRFVRLVRADANRLVDDLPTLARLLAAKQVAVDWTGAAHLILSAGGPHEEDVRRRVARDFYGALRMAAPSL